MMDVDGAWLPEGDSRVDVNAVKDDEGVNVVGLSVAGQDRIGETGGSGRASCAKTGDSEDV